MISKKRGFTILELLVVIAIIGILSAVGLVSFNIERRKARIASVLQSLSSAKAAAMVCMSGGEQLGRVSVSDHLLVAGEPICPTSVDKWPSLPAYWNLVGGLPGGTSCHICPSDIYEDRVTSDGNFKFCAFSKAVDDDTAVICTENGCKVYQHYVSGGAPGICLY